MKLPIFYVKFMKRYIDLSSLVEVTDPEFVDRMGYGGWFVGFNYRFAGDEKSRTHMRELRDDVEVKRLQPTEEHDGYKYSHPLLAITSPNGARIFIDPQYSKLDDYNILAVQNMRAEMQELLDAWQRWKEVEPQVYALLKA